MASQEQSRSVVEVGIELVDHALVAEDAEEADDEGEEVHQTQRCDAEQQLLLLRLEL